MTQNTTNIAKALVSGNDLPDVSTSLTCDELIAISDAVQTLERQATNLRNLWHNFQAMKSGLSTNEHDRVIRLIEFRLSSFENNFARH